MRRALFDRRVKRDPEARARLERGIIAQRQAAMQEAIESDPELAMQAQAQQQQAMAAAAPPPQENTQQQPANVGELLDMLSNSGGAPMGAQPAMV
jgi:hypothetical protein